MSAQLEQSAIQMKRSVNHGHRAAAPEPDMRDQAKPVLGTNFMMQEQAKSST